MAKALSDFRERISGLPKWGAYALLIAAAVVGYFGFIGYQWWTSSGELEETEAQITKLNKGLRAPIASEADLNASLSTRTEILDEWKALYSYNGYEEWEHLFADVDNEGPNLLVIIVSDIAEKSDVDLISYALSDPKLLPTEDEVSFNTQPLTLSLEGKSHRSIYDFLAALHDSVPSSV